MSRQDRRSHRGRARAVPGRAVLAGDPRRRIVFVSGQLALRPGEKELAGELDRRADGANVRQPPGDPRAGGLGADSLVKTTVFLPDLGDFAGMNEVYSKHVGDTPPARSTVEVAKLPSGALVEIEAVALVYFSKIFLARRTAGAGAGARPVRAKGLPPDKKKFPSREGGRKWVCVC